MRISLIEPSSLDYHVFSMFNLPRLGLPILGTILKEKGHEVKVYIEDLYPIDYEKIYNSDLVGISTITSTVPRAYDIAKKIKKKNIKVIIGGSHVTFLPEEALKHADYVVRGEGEKTLIELVDSIEGNKKLETILGLSYHENGSVFHNQERELLNNLDSYPYPDFNIIHGLEKDLDKLSSIPIITSRGCPFDCSFCSVTKMFGRKYRFRDTNNVIEEISSRLHDSKKWFFFYDDNFAANPTRTKILLEEILRKGMKFSWTAQTRSDVVKDKEMMELMKRTNCQFLYIGFESINPKTLELYNKKQLVDEIGQAIKVIHDYGIKVHGMFVLGSDEDTQKTIQDTSDFVSKNKIDTVQYLILTPLPGTEIYKQMKKENRIITNEWNLYDGLHAVFRPLKMSASKLEEETILAMNKFYSIFKSLSFFLKGKFYSSIIRFKGNTILRKWKKRKKEFLERIIKKDSMHFTK